jgi:hypothetical protein
MPALVSIQIINQLALYKNGIYKETSIVNKYFDDLRLKCLICSVKANGRGRLQ